MDNAPKNFTHFKIHTQYSICEGAIKIDDLKNICKDKKIKSSRVVEPKDFKNFIELFKSGKIAIDTKSCSLFYEEILEKKFQKTVK